MWIEEAALPLWLEKGIDRNEGGFGGFVESLSLQGEPLPLPRRAMVQARQIYTLRMGLEKNWIRSSQKAEAQKAIERGAELWLERYSLPSGAFLLAVDSAGRATDLSVELYAQAFAIFGLAHAFAFTSQERYRARAFEVLDYLERERRWPQGGGGYTEIKSGQILFQSNPHMHLFEAALTWMELDSDPRWRRLADELLDLCLHHFVDPQSGFLAEHFDEKWQPLRESGRFLVEPGHQYEWAWLMGLYEKSTGKNLSVVREKLFANTEKWGLDSRDHMAFDEIWSDGSVKLASSRFWPQAERVKCAAQMRKVSMAEEAMQALLKFFATPVAGLWFDRREADGSFRQEPAKASSFYHIMGAFLEYDRL